MPDYAVALICIAIVIVAILISSLIKVIMKKVAKNNGGELDCEKWEYLFAAISLILSAAGVFCFLRFYVGVTDVNILIKNTGLYAGCTQTIYLFIVQLVRKGGKGLFTALKNIFAKLKTSKNPVQELPEIVKEETATVTESSDVTKLKNEFAKIMKGDNK